MRTFKLPDLGEGLQEAEIVAWHVKPGDSVAADQPLLSVETAKAIVEIPSPFSGQVARLPRSVRVARTASRPRRRCGRWRASCRWTSPWSRPPAMTG